MLAPQTGLIASLLLAGSTLCAAASVPYAQHEEAHHDKIAPKVFIVSMFAPEAEIWWNIPEFDILAHNITVPGLSPIYPDVHCTEDFEICQLITGESEINAATTVTSVAFSSLFNLTQTYFFIAGIAGVNPERATLGSATFARYAVQVALQYEIDIRELPSTYKSGYFPLGADFPDQYPTSIYGTEVFEVNDDLRHIAAKFARRGNLTDSTEAKAYRAHYNTTNGQYKAATLPPSIVECDVATSDVYYSGNILGHAFANTTKLFTNGTGDYCTSAQEDNATLEALMRAAVHKLTDFSRIIVMRTASDFDRPYPDLPPLTTCSTLTPVVIPLPSQTSTAPVFTLWRAFWVTGRLPSLVVLKLPTTLVISSVPLVASLISVLDAPKLLSTAELTRSAVFVASNGSRLTCIKIDVC
ncbi:hypothetical protein N7504_007487 [Penicillium tannophilum]|nr:hypothetical protein N7504_007487 [Penicillium tannophilum]